MDKYIRFDWAAKRMLRNKANYAVLEGLMTVLLDEKVSYADLRAAAFKQAKKLLRQVGLFDVYRGDKIPAGKKQYALSFVFQDLEKTLTDAEIEKVMAKLLNTFINEYGAVLR